MTSSFPPNVGNKRFLVSNPTTFMTATDGTGDTNLTYPFSGFSAELDFSGVPADDETMVIGSVTYTFKDSPVTTGTNNIEIGGSADITAENTRQALIDGSALHSGKEGSNTLYGASTVINPDILHAEIGISANVVHITSATSITITTAAAANTDGLTLDGVALTATVHYHGSDFTELKANSVEANSKGVAITGIGWYRLDGTACTDSAIAIYSHDGVWAAGAYVNGPQMAVNNFVAMNLPGGPAARAKVSTDEEAMVVFYA